MNNNTEYIYKKRVFPFPPDLHIKLGATAWCHSSSGRRLLTIFPDPPVTAFPLAPSECLPRSAAVVCLRPDDLGLPLSYWPSTCLPSPLSDFFFFIVNFFQSVCSLLNMIILKVLKRCF
ncbi:hypothetical protein J6590_007014 [Homalodisca vitripennis]|nr:hypothetical protein J6590_007014 [Homalodisca vitripennis]